MKKLFCTTQEFTGSPPTAGLNLNNLNSINGPIGSNRGTLATSPTGS